MAIILTHIYLKFTLFYTYTQKHMELLSKSFQGHTITDFYKNY